MSELTKSELFILAECDYNTYLISGMNTFFNSSIYWYSEYKKRKGKRKLEYLEKYLETK